MALSRHRTQAMLRRSLTKTNPYLADPAKRREIFEMTVYTSTDIEGIKLSHAELLPKARTSRRIISFRESVKSYRSRR